MSTKIGSCNNCDFVLSAQIYACIIEAFLYLSYRLTQESDTKRINILYYEAKTGKSQTLMSWP